LLGGEKGGSEINRPGHAGVKQTGQRATKGGTRTKTKMLKGMTTRIGSTTRRGVVRRKKRGIRIVQAKENRSFKFKQKEEGQQTAK